MVERRGALPEVASLQKALNRLFEQLVQFQGSDATLSMGEWFPGVDVYENARNVVVKVEAPEFTANDLSVVFKQQKMVVSGEKKQPPEDRSAHGYLCLERSFGKFSRSIYIDQAVDLTKASATLADGVLTVTLPKVVDRRGTEMRLPIEEADEAVGTTSSAPSAGTAGTD